MGLLAANDNEKPSLEPVRRKPVISNAATGVLGSFVVRARQESAARPQGEESFASGRGLNLNLSQKKAGARKHRLGKNSGRQGNKTHDSGGLTEAEKHQLTIQSQIAEEKARRYEAIERGEIAADDEYNVDFSTRAPSEAARQRSETPPSPGNDVHPRSPAQGWGSQHFQRQRSRSPSPRQDYSTTYPSRSHQQNGQRAPPEYAVSDQQPQERASPTYEPYRARSNELASPTYATAGGSRRRAGLGYGAPSHEWNEQDDSSPNEERDRTKQRHYQEFLKRQEKWQLAEDEQERQRAILKEALPAEQERVKRVMAQAQKQKDEEVAMQERLVDLMMAKDKAERKAKRRAAKKK